MIIDGSGWELWKVGRRGIELVQFLVSQNHHFSLVLAQWSGGTRLVDGAAESFKAVVLTLGHHRSMDRILGSIALF